MADAPAATHLPSLFKSSFMIKLVFPSSVLRYGPFHIHLQTLNQLKSALKFHAASTVVLPSHYLLSLIPTVFPDRIRTVFFFLSCFYGKRENMRKRLKRSRVVQLLTHVVVASFVVLIFALYMDGELGQERALATHTHAHNYIFNTTK